jgi:hypothetical protein
MNCTDKFLKHSERVGARFAEHNAGKSSVPWASQEWSVASRSRVMAVGHDSLVALLVEREILGWS